MLRLFETRTGQVVGVRPGPLKLYVQQPDDLRVCLTADLLRRLAPRLRRRTLTTAAHDVDHTPWNIPPLHGGDPLPGSLSVGNVTSATEVAVAEWTAPPGDPLAVRLLLLSVHYRAEARIGPESLAGAESRLDAWRRDIARWGTTTARPLHQPTADRAIAALCEDLDAPAALAVLDDLAASDLEPGAKFETAVHLDLVFGLDLVRDLGKY
ncbi:hypothetical protein [Actinocorallia longicatena]|uniref:Cysteinyl-tRNA synthetase n=1 Tax=Actinocorallia longicatena TaxID=111803 RepID=A0ABP6Q120_9ACTN